MASPKMIPSSYALTPVPTARLLATVASLVGFLLITPSTFASTTSSDQAVATPLQKTIAPAKSAVSSPASKNPKTLRMCTVFRPMVTMQDPDSGITRHIPAVVPPPSCLAPKERALHEQQNSKLQALHDLYGKRATVAAQTKRKPQASGTNAPTQAQFPVTATVQSNRNIAMASNRAGMARPAVPFVGLHPEMQGALRIATTGLPPEVQAAYDAANQMVQFNSATPNVTHDANGNLTSLTDANGTTTFTWDARNRLIARNGPGINESFAYDALNRRVSKTSNGETTQYLYDGLNIIAEIKGGAVTAFYLRGLVIDEPFIRISAAGNEYYHRDAQGSTLALTDDSGAVKTRYSYDPFGNTTVTGTPSTNPFQYTGRENDGAGLYYLRARYYSPQLQRFLSEDRIGFFGGDTNLYAYVWNNPTRYGDPLGLWGTGLTVSATAVYGLGPAGTAATSSVSAGVFGGGSQGINVGGVESSGTFAGGPGYGPSYPPPSPDAPNFAVGIFAGAGGGFFLTNATSPADLERTTSTASYDIGVPPLKLSIQYSYGGGIGSFAVTAGPGAGIARSNITTNTTVLGKRK